MDLSGTEKEPPLLNLLDTHNSVFTCYVYQEMMYKLKKELKQISFNDFLSRPQMPWSEIFIGCTELGAELEPYAKTFIARIARNIFDYLLLACWGEMRHASTEGLSRKSTYKKGIDFDPIYSLPVLATAFRTLHWGSGYGGTVWAKIVEAASIYLTFNPILFLDHAVDLSHHGGLVFNKGIIVDQPEKYRYLFMLNAKQDGSILALKDCYFNDPALPIEVHSKCLNELRVARTIDSFRGPPSISNVPFIAWGTKVLTHDLLLELLEVRQYGSQEEEEKESRPRRVHIIQTTDLPINNSEY